MDLTAVRQEIARTMTVALGFQVDPYEPKSVPGGFVQLDPEQVITYPTMNRKLISVRFNLIFHMDRNILAPSFRSLDDMLTTGTDTSVSTLINNCDPANAGVKNIAVVGASPAVPSKVGDTDTLAISFDILVTA